MRGYIIDSMRSHQMLDRRSLALHELVADKIRADPALLERARENLRRWRPTMSAGSLPYLDEWERLVGAGLEACLAVATEDSERATALRQSTPFGGVLTNVERNRFFRDWSDT